MEETLVISGRENTQKFRLLALRKMLQLEVRTGMTMSRRSVAQVIRQQFDIKKRKKADVLAEFEKKLREMGLTI